MEGITVIRADKNTSTAQKESSLRLLQSDHGVEIMLQTVEKGHLVMLTPSEEKDVRESAFLAEGELQLETEDEQIRLEKNDFFSFENLPKPVMVKCISPATLFYITTRPTYQNAKVYVSNLDELINKINDKDKYTKLHCQHVMDYSIAISQKIRNCEANIEKLTISALFHDVGKCCIPDEILNKPGALTPEERKFIFKHPLESKTIVEADFGEDIAKIVLCHHERQDGSGYPMGISGVDIPIEARIIAVADSFDAMTTKRPYNSPKSYREAVDELTQMKTVYDESAVSALRQLVEEGEIERITKLGIRSDSMVTKNDRG